MDVKDMLEIQNTLALYGHVIDRKEWSRFSEIATPDFVFDLTASGVPEGESPRGMEQVLEHLTTAKHPVAHHVTNVYIYEQDGETRVRSKWLCATGQGGVLGGDYEDVWVRTEDGWRMRHRTVVARHGLEAYMNQIA